MDDKIDTLDRQILRFLQQDSRMPFLEIARALNVSGGTIHARVNRLKEDGIIDGSKIIINYNTLGYSVAAFVGIRLSKAGSVQQIQNGLAEIPEIVEVHYTTGSYSLLVKIVVSDMNSLYELLSSRLQTMKEIQSTETFVILNSPVMRDLKL